MPFGASMKSTSQSGTASVEGSYANIWMDPQRGSNRTGRRVFRILPDISSSTGVLVMPEEAAFAEYWITVKAQGKDRKQRVMIAPDRRYNNPVFNRLFAHLPKEEREIAKLRFAINVLDKTKTIAVDVSKNNGSKETVYAYPNEKNEYYTADGAKLAGVPAPLNQVRILEGSNGREGGKHMMQGLIDLIGVTHPTDEDRVMSLYEFDIALRIAGEGTNTRRVFSVGGDFNPIPEKYITLPRFNLQEWAKPWDDGALEALLNGEDLYEVVQSYNITLTPKLVG